MSSHIVTAGKAILGSDWNEIDVRVGLKRFFSIKILISAEHIEICVSFFSNLARYSIVKVVPFQRQTAMQMRYAMTRNEDEAQLLRC